MLRQFAFRDKVSSRSAEVKYTRKEFSTSEIKENEPWALWNVDFGSNGSQAAEQEIKVTYEILSSDAYYTDPYDVPAGVDALRVASASFYYILHTGQGWKGTIGSSVIRAKIPKEIPLNQKEFIDKTQKCQN